MEAFKCLRATCRQLKDEVEDVFFLKGRFDVVVMKKDGEFWGDKDGNVWGDGTPVAKFYIERVRNLAVQSWVRMDLRECVFLDVGLEMRDGRWEVKFLGNCSEDSEILDGRSVVKLREAVKEAEIEIKRLMGAKEDREGLRWEDVEAIRRILMHVQ